MEGARPPRNPRIVEAMERGVCDCYVHDTTQTACRQWSVERCHPLFTCILVLLSRLIDM